MIKTIGLAIAFSPTAEKMLAEAAYFADVLQAKLVLIHIGEHGQKEDELMASLLAQGGLTNAPVVIHWNQGNPVNAILRACDVEKVDLLIAGALKKEGLLGYYLGTVARDIMRRASCSVMLLTQPSIEPTLFKNIVVDAEDNPYVEESIALACKLSSRSKGAWIHVVRELKMYGLVMAASDQCSEDEYENIRQGLVRDEIEKVEQILQRIPHENIKVNIKVISGKSGFELAQFALKKQADMLIVSAPPRRFKFFDRIFTHDLEYVFADLPCNLLIVQEERRNHA